MLRPHFVLILIALASCAVCHVAMADPSAPTNQAPRETSEDNELLLVEEPVVTSASKQPERISDSPVAVTVITADDIRRSGATNIPDLLRSVPGLEVMEQNASQQNVAIRGVNETYANQILVMVDGRPIYDTAYGNTFWNTLPLLMSQIARIEVVRGPGSALYGANAFSGVVNIITKTPLELASQGDKATFIGAVGSQQSLFSETTLTLGGSHSWAGSIGAGYHSTAGFGGQGTGQVHDSSRVPIFTVDLEKALPRGNLRLSASESDANADLTAGVAEDDARFQTSDFNLSYIGTGTDAPVTARFSGNYFRINDSDQPSDTFAWSNTTYDLEVQQQRAISAAHHLVYGVGFRSTVLSSLLLGGRSAYEGLESVYLQDEWRLAATTSVFAGLRWDHNSVYGSEFSPRISLVHHLDHAQTLRLSYGQAFRAPALLDSYADENLPVMPGFSELLLGNTAVKPEQVKSVEAGWRRDLPHGYAAASAFENHISDLINFTPVAFAPSPPFPADTPVTLETENGGGLDLAGVELEGELRPSRTLRIQANYSYQNVVAHQGNLAQIPAHNLLNVIVQADPSQHVSASVTGHYVDATGYPGLATGGSGAPGVSTTVPAYIRVDAKIGYHVGAYEWSLVGTNLLGNGHIEYPEEPLITGQPQTDKLERTVWVMFSAGLR
jgi:outer membrane receptor for ferrienterochelin and colicin